MLFYMYKDNILAGWQKGFLGIQSGFACIETHDALNLKSLIVTIEK